MLRRCGMAVLGALVLRFGGVVVSVLILAAGMLVELCWRSRSSRGLALEQAIALVMLELGS